MKSFLISFALLFFCSCGNHPKNKADAVASYDAGNGVTVKEVAVNGHVYLIAQVWHRGVSVIHSESCFCKGHPTITY
jgi:hypothetical protein